MLFKTQSAAVYGIDANIIEVEVDVCSRQLDQENFQTVGLPDAAVVFCLYIARCSTFSGNGLPAVSGRNGAAASPRR